MFKRRSSRLRRISSGGELQIPMATRLSTYLTKTTLEVTSCSHTLRDLWTL